MNQKREDRKIITACSYCKRIQLRKKGKWHKKNTKYQKGMRLSHGCCPSCKPGVMLRMEAEMRRLGY